MPSDRRRILELALDSLQEKKRKIDEEIAEITQELRGRSARRASSALPAPARAKRSSRFSKEERLKRSQRMKAYWENWRKKKAKK